MKKEKLAIVLTAFLGSLSATQAAYAQTIHWGGGSGVPKDSVPGWGQCPGTPIIFKNQFDSPTICAGSKVFGLFHSSGGYILDKDGISGPNPGYLVIQFDFRYSDFLLLQGMVDSGEVIPDTQGNVTLSLKTNAHSGGEVPYAQGVGFSESAWWDGVGAYLEGIDGNWPLCITPRLPVEAREIHKLSNGAWTNCVSTGFVWGTSPQTTWAGAQQGAGYFIDGSFVALAGQNTAPGILWRDLDPSAQDVCTEVHAMLTFDYQNAKGILDMWDYYGGSPNHIGTLDNDPALLSIQLETCLVMPSWDSVPEPILLEYEELTGGGSKGAGAGDAIGSLPQKLH